jgi:choline dehydrogenase-like flavoprotein
VSSGSLSAACSPSDAPSSTDRAPARSSGGDSVGGEGGDEGAGFALEALGVEAEVGEDMPQETNRITLHDSRKDQHGLPIPNVHFDDHPNDIAMRSHAYRQGAAVYDAVGAVRTFPTPPYPSTHNLGTNRMSEKPRDGVVNKWGQTHDVANLFVSDGSQFTTGGAENPTLTIVSLAIRQADYIAGQMGQKAL